MAKRNLSFQVDEELADALDEAARDAAVSRSELIRQSIVDDIENGGIDVPEHHAILNEYEEFKSEMEVLNLREGAEERFRNLIRTKFDADWSPEGVEVWAERVKGFTRNTLYGDDEDDRHRRRREELCNYLDFLVEEYRKKQGASVFDPDEHLFESWTGVETGLGADSEDVSDDELRQAARESLAAGSRVDKDATATVLVNRFGVSRSDAETIVDEAHDDLVGGGGA
jgi:predicted transcriptional regulator